LNRLGAARKSAAWGGSSSDIGVSTSDFRLSSDGPEGSVRYSSADAPWPALVDGPRHTAVLPKAVVRSHVRNEAWRVFLSWTLKATQKATAMSSRDRNKCIPRLVHLQIMIGKDQTRDGVSQPFVRSGIRLPKRSERRLPFFRESCQANKNILQ
jgi:hypothetical protein